MSFKEIKIINKEGTLVTKVVSKSSNGTPFLFWGNFFCHRVSVTKKMEEKKK